jgi:hypothetical protein
LTADELVGSLSINDVKITAAKATLKNSETKTAEFVTQKTTKRTVFDGTYTAKKNDVYLNEFIIEETTAKHLNSKDDITFYLYIDGKAVADSTLKSSDNEAEGNFSDVLVKA